MGTNEGYEVSGMARHRAQRHVDEICAIEDPVERLRRLILSANTAEQAYEGFDGDVLEFMASSKGFNHALRVAVRTLLEVGGTEFPLLEGGLRERAIETELRSSGMIEQSLLAKGGDITDLYFDVDGGSQPLPASSN